MTILLLLLNWCQYVGIMWNVPSVQRINNIVCCDKKLEILFNRTTIRKNGKFAGSRNAFRRVVYADYLLVATVITTIHKE